MDRLKKKFMGNTYLKYAEETSKLSRFRLKPNESLPDHLSEMRRLMETIAEVGGPLDEYARPALLIVSLPRDYEHVVQTFLASHKSENADDPPNYEQLELALEMGYGHRQGRRVRAQKEKMKTKPFTQVAVFVVEAGVNAGVALVFEDRVAVDMLVVAVVKR
ncbi:hypothetical protein PHMEG_00026123 [Phytophthora megakarya]|uniref:Polyprotein n=1 Tax=Phytophthora megakarya TaxID=4795 RepID=A0A225V9Z2_9STRA|nr:hypothetical protein PHMEG_00026123 [Phytophthora megakarya]